MSLIGDVSFKNKLLCKTLLPTEAAMTTWGTSIGAAAPAIAECGTVPNLIGFAMTTGDAVQWWLELASLPWLNPARDIQAQLILAQSNAAAFTDGVFTISAKVFASGVALTLPTTTPSGSVAVTVSSVAVADSMLNVPPAGLGIAAALSAAGARTLGILVACTTDGGWAGDDLKLCGVNLFYTSQMEHPSGVGQST